MKAKHFKIIRSNMRYYNVVMTHGLFGDFREDFLYRFSDSTPLVNGTRILTESAVMAVKKYCKRKHIRYNDFTNETNSTFGKFRVVPTESPYARHVKYFN